jgi:hypothetical protein
MPMRGRRIRRQTGRGGSARLPVPRVCDTESPTRLPLTQNAGADQVVARRHQSDDPIRGKGSVDSTLGPVAIRSSGCRGLGPRKRKRDAAGFEQSGWARAGSLQAISSVSVA